jgi:rhodanese-related sulfurtransferase
MIKVIKAEDIHANELKHIIDVRSRDEYLQEHIPNPSTFRWMNCLILSTPYGKWNPLS